jgi:hypothetical protein
MCEIRKPYTVIGRSSVENTPTISKDISDIQPHWSVVGQEHPHDLKRHLRHNRRFRSHPTEPFHTTAFPDSNFLPFLLQPILGLAAHRRLRQRAALPHTTASFNVQHSV